jgi:polar amino acid transport system substrate-binding protein
MIDPHYYSGGSALLTRKDSGIDAWEDLQGKRVCGTQGAYYNRIIAEEYGADVVAFPGTAEAHNALLAGDCVGFLQDSTLHAAAVLERRWSDYHSPLPVRDEVGWNMAIPTAEADGPYGDFMRSVVEDWHRTGYLLELEEKWNLSPSSPLVQAMHEKYKGQ